MLHSLYINLLNLLFILTPTEPITKRGKTRKHGKVGVKRKGWVLAQPPYIYYYYYLGSISQQTALQVLYYCRRQSHIKNGRGGGVHKKRKDKKIWKSRSKEKGVGFSSASLYYYYYYLGSILQQTALQALYYCRRQSHIKD